MVDKNTRANIWTEFEKMRIKHERLAPAHKVFDDLRATRRDAPFEPKRFASIFAPTHSGKSTAVSIYLETRVAEDAIRRGLFPPETDRKLIARQQRIVLYISLEGVTSIKNLAQEILLALGKNERGTASDLLKLAYDHLQVGTELLIIDETQHLKTTKERRKFAELKEGETALTNTLKTMLIRGLVPMCFIGIPEARSLLFNDPQLAGRCVEEIDYSCLDFAVPSDRKIFRNYCGRLGLKLQQHGLFEQASNFLCDDIAECLHAASSGRIGIVSRIVEQAAAFATEEGASQVLREHLAKAVDRWSIPNNTVTYNPFRAGIRTAELVQK
jgi:AAA domain